MAGRFAQETKSGIIGAGAGVVALAVGVIFGLAQLGWWPFDDGTSQAGSTTDESDDSTTDRTDYSVFVCSQAWDQSGGRDEASGIVDALRGSDRVGEVGDGTDPGYTEWTLHDEVPVDQLRGWVTVVEDSEHPEASEADWVVDHLVAEGIVSEDDVQIVDNVGSDTPWRLSIVSCPVE